VILSTPSLDSFRVNNDPRYRYDGNLSARSSNGADHRMLSYDRLENRRYQSLRMKPPTQSYITRIYDERCKIFTNDSLILTCHFIFASWTCCYTSC